MASNYRKLGDVIKLVDERNVGGNVTNLLGVSIDKRFIPSVANVIGTDLTKYKVVRKNRFACSLMQVSRDHKMPISRYSKDELSIISPAYVTFELAGNDVLPEYLELLDAAHRVRSRGRLLCRRWRARKHDLGRVMRHEPCGPAHQATAQNHCSAQCHRRKNRGPRTAK